jgi:hypothetical protein
LISCPNFLDSSDGDYRLSEQLGARGVSSVGSHFTLLGLMQTPIGSSLLLVAELSLHKTKSEEKALNCSMRQLLGWPGPARLDGGADASAGTEFASNYGPDRVTCLHYILKHLVDDVFLKNTHVAVTEEVLLERFQFETAQAGHVADGEVAEVRQAGFRAD